MGIFKRIVHAATKDWKNANAQWKSVLKVERIEKGEKVLPPKHPREVEPFEKAAKDPKLKALVDKKDEKLIENVNKIKIESHDPPERWTSTKELPTRESEWEHRNDPTWQYGFYEPPLEKMQKDHLMFKEALEVLRFRMEYELPGLNGKKRDFADESLEKYKAHPAVGRVDPEKLDRLWTYFRPFERQDKQRVVHKRDLKELADFIEGRELDRLPEHEPVKEAMLRLKDQSHRASFAKKLLQMKEEDRKEFLEALRQNQLAQKERLDKRLEEMKLLDAELTKSAEATKEEEEKKAKGE